ncbi:MAG: sigma-70 family RNA polymerase sigma factor [Oscillospiraceae bacterium]|nr:sigma-70 family RNA polymerase sigma factor [Oscillospiraceae bacterium]
MEQNSVLLQRAQRGDRAAAEQILEDNTGLIWSIVRRYFGRGVDPEDLYQLGCLGLIKAIDGFDEEYGTRFSTYAVPKIAGEIRRFLRDDGAIKVSRGLKERAQQIHAARHTLEQSLGREPTVGELSEKTGIPVEDIAEAETALSPAESLQRENGEEGLTLEHVLGDGGQEERVLERVALRAAIDRLPDKEQKVVFLRFFHGLTQSDCARILKVSQVQISRLERKAVEDLRLIMQ